MKIQQYIPFHIYFLTQALSLKIPLSLSTYNRFKPLAASENMDTEVSKAYDVQVNKSKPPPIIMDYKYDLSKIIRLCDDDHTFKKTSIGVKVFSTSFEKFDALQKKFTEAKLSFHTHRIRDRGFFKMIIVGLPTMKTNIIEEDLEQKGIPFDSVIALNTKRTTAEDCLYLVTLKRSAVSKKDLHTKVKFIARISIKWRNSYQNKQGPTQCNKCSMYGHGAENCFRISICKKCSQEHLTEKCTVHEIRCHNCIQKKYINIDHRADDPRCPFREDYIIARSRAVSKPQRNKTKVVNSLNELHQEHVPLTRTQIPTTTMNLVPTYADKVKEKPSHTQDLFSTDELFNIFIDASVQLKKCSSKLEQLQVIMGILKYAV